jgi:cytochrome c
MRTLSIIILALVCFIGSCNHLKKPHQSNAANSNADASASPGLPSGRGTPDEAKAMLAKAIEHYNEAGRTQALADFNKMKSPFGDRDLYVFCLGLNHKVSANGGFDEYVGMSADVFKDADGKSLGKAILDQAETSGEGSIEYMWTNPVSHLTEHKVAFFKKVGEDVCGVGAYQ